MVGYPISDWCILWTGALPWVYVAICLGMWGLCYDPALKRGPTWPLAILVAAIVVRGLSALLVAVRSEKIRTRWDRDFDTTVRSEGNVPHQVLENSSAPAADRFSGDDSVGYHRSYRVVPPVILKVVHLVPVGIVACATLQRPTLVFPVSLFAVVTVILTAIMGVAAPLEYSVSAERLWIGRHGKELLNVKLDGTGLSCVVERARLTLKHAGYRIVDIDLGNVTQPRTLALKIAAWAVCKPDGSVGVTTATSESRAPYCEQVKRCALCDRNARPAPSGLNGHIVCRTCRLSYIGRRQAAYAVDCTLLYVAPLLLLIQRGYSIVGATATYSAGMTLCLLILLRIPLLVRDTVRGRSPGKWLTGLRVVRLESGEPISAAPSVGRNLVLCVPVVSELILAVQIQRGHRMGDNWSGACVAWDRYRFRAPFCTGKFLCRECGYDLQGAPLNTTRCSECGAATSR